MTYILRARGLVDPDAAETKGDPWLLIEDSVIRQVGCGKPPSGDYATHNFPESYVMPGLIDAHVHLVLEPNGQLAESTLLESDSTLFARAAGHALRALSVGVTTLRDCGGREMITVDLRDAVDNRLVPGARIVAAGPPLTYTGGHCHYFGGEVDGAHEVSRRVRGLLKEGADFIKMMGSGGGTSGTVPNAAYFTTEEYAAAVESAHRVGKRVHVHILCSEAARRAIEAGVDGFEHGSFLDENQNSRIVGRVAEAGISVTSTLGVFQHVLDRVGSDISSEKRAMWTEMLEAEIGTARAYHQAGVPVVFGTDAGWRYTLFDDPLTEFECMAAAGMTNAQVLRSATELAAHVVGLGDELGRLEVGYQADMVLLSADPLQDLEAVRKVEAVIKAGRIWNAPGNFRRLMGWTQPTEA